MGVPKSKISVSRRGKRRMFYRVNISVLGRCSNCGMVKRPYFVCGSCGFYRNRKIPGIVTE